MNGKDGLKMLNEAIALAVKAHEGQTRMDGKTPYIMHPFAVMNILTEMGYTGSDKLLAAAVLHDVLEDCGAEYDAIISQLDPTVHLWVSCLTCHGDADEYNKGFKDFPLEVHWVKCADIIHNVSNHPRPWKYAPKKMRQLMSMNRHVFVHTIFQRAYELCKEKIEEDIFRG